MSIRTISTGQLRRMGDQEGLILQGCGGDPQEWVDGINEILAKEGILKKGAGFEEAYTFRHDGLTCMLFPFKEDIELDVGKLAAWRLASYSTFGGTWLSDYVPNRLGGFIQEQKTAPERIKPDCPLVGEDGNISVLWELPQRHSGRMECRNRRRKCAAEFFNARAMIPP